MITCGKCGKQSPAGKRFCGDCGATLAGAVAVDDVVLRETIRSILKESIADQKVVELETAQAVATRLSDWGKLFGFFVGIPLAILVVGLGALGIKTYADFSGVVKKGTTDVTAQVQATKLQITQLDREGDELTRQYGELRARLTDNQQLVSQVEELAKRVDVIGEKLGFAPTSKATPQQRSALTQAFARFSAYLRQLGYAPTGGGVSIDVNEDMPGGAMAYYEPGTATMVLDKRYADNPAIMYREYMHHVLYGKAGLARLDADRGWMYSAIESGLATYISCSFQNNPRATASAWDLSRNVHQLNEVRDVSSAMRVGTELWGSAFWEIRGVLGAQAADRLLYETWRQLDPRMAPAAVAQDFARRIIDKTPPAQRAAVRGAFTRRGIVV